MLGGALAFAAMGALVHALGPRCDWLVVALVRALVMLASAAALARAAGSRLVGLAAPDALGPEPGGELQPGLQLLRADPAAGGRRGDADPTSTRSGSS